MDCKRVVQSAGYCPRSASREGFVLDVRGPSGSLSGVIGSSWLHFGAALDTYLLLLKNGLEQQRCANAHPRSARTIHSHFVSTFSLTFFVMFRILVESTCVLDIILSYLGRSMMGAHRNPCALVQSKRTVGCSGFLWIQLLTK